MLKFLFWTLLLANGLLFAYERGYVESTALSGREPGRMHNQLNANKVKIVPPPDKHATPPVTVASTAAPAVASASASAPAAAPPTTSRSAATASAAAPSAATPSAASLSASTASAMPQPSSTAKATPSPVAATAEKKPDLIACMEIGNFKADEAARFADQIKTAGLSEYVKEHNVQKVASNIVYIPPQPDELEGAERKAGELRRLGITDFYIIRDNSPLQWGISLGVFKTEEAAHNHLATLMQKGVRTARVGQRTVTANLTAYQFRELDEQKKSAVNKIKAGFPKLEERACNGA